MVKNLNQLKKALVAGVEFEILMHNRPECVGQIRIVTKANTVGIYTIIPNEPNNRVNKSNNGLGSFLDWGLAKSWTFDAEGVCAKYSDYKYTPNEILIAFKTLEV